jgi:hypothetical protein
LTKTHPEKISLLLRSEIQISEGTLSKSDRERPETKENKEVLINKLYHLYKKTMQMKGRR